MIESRIGSNAITQWMGWIMISRWLCAVYNLARVKSIKRNVEHTVHGYIRIIKLNITIAKDRSYSKLLSEKFSPLQFPWTMNYNEERNQSRTSIFVRIRSIAFNEWKQTGKGFFAWKVRGVRISSLPSLGRRGGRGEEEERVQVVPRKWRREV